ncbi:hypothetical protein M8C21_008252, partial [Ambrosia artemisiifolia]
QHNLNSGGIYPEKRQRIDVVAEEVVPGSQHKSANRAFQRSILGFLMGCVAGLGGGGVAEIRDLGDTRHQETKKEFPVAISCTNEVTICNDGNTININTKMSNFLDALNMIGKAEKLENYSVLMLTFYLIDVWELGIVYAAGLINIWLGITKLMPFAILFLFDNKYVGSYTMLIISTATSALGTGLLSLSTPSWFYSSITGSCDNYKMKCITEIQKWLFYLALVLIMIGRSSRKATVETLNFKNRAIKQERTHDLFPSAGYWLNNEASALVLAPWSILFGMPSVYTSMALYHLKGKSWSHKIYINEPERSPLTSVLRVVAASILNISQDKPYEDCDETEIDEPLLNRSFSLRFLEKAALQPPHDKGWPNRWTHCSIQEVENAKTIVRMLPVGFMFAFLVLIYTIGMTYFPQQWKRLNLLDYSTVLQIERWTDSRKE